MSKNFLTEIFEAISSDTAQIDSSKDIVVRKYETVHQDDCEAVTLIDPNIDCGPWIAGGACLRWYQGLPVDEADIDVFCKDARQAQKVIDTIKSFGRFQVKWESENAVTISHHRKDDWTTSWTIQVITKRYFASLKDVINNFDITVCEIGTGGDEWVLGAFTARDIREKNLRFKLPLQPDAPKRLVKYWTYGYRPVEGTVQAIQNTETIKWAFSNEEEYNNAF